jgi:CDP-paratose synthetase
MNIFITGGTGYLGGQLSAALSAEGHNLHFLVRESSRLSKIKDMSVDGGIHYDNIDKFDDVLKDNGIEVVIHCATHYGRNDTDPLNTLKSNLLMPIRLLDAAASANVKCFINTGTMLDKRVSFYSLSKSHFDDWMLHYSDRIKCINILLEHFYGPNDDPTKFVSFVINNLKQNHEKIDLTKGEQERDFVYIDDVVNAFLIVIKSVDSFNGMTTLELGSGVPIKIRDFVILAKNLAKNEVTKLNFGAIPYRENEVMQSRADITKLRALGWVNKTDLVTGLKKTIWD